ncbi:unnamed protein product [Caenorhabditis angaria]|uniref:Uncharacterized protein n=1 Tax=Caenorhabditis angaria TaxID=860376 RepID=A0A9P1MZS0_9PELO|nr:unnamed protein product [Caenorhabditis angaria]
MRNVESQIEVDLLANISQEFGGDIPQDTQKERKEVSSTKTGFEKKNPNFGNKNPDFIIHQSEQKNHISNQKTVTNIVIYTNIKSIVK